MSWAVLAGSLAAVLALAGIARLLGLGVASPLTEAQACRIAADRAIGFIPVRAIIGDEGSTALVLGDDAAVAIRQHGMGMVVARLCLPLSLSRQSGGIRLDSGDARIGALVLPADPDLLTYL
jgi:hypothetical protein